MRTNKRKPLVDLKKFDYLMENDAFTLQEILQIRGYNNPDRPNEIPIIVQIREKFLIPY